jgi:iron complex outermembrane recepter protein
LKCVPARVQFALGTAGAVAWLAMPALGQEIADDRDAAERHIRVFVTGSNIPAVERETGLPVQVITRDEIERANFQTAAELINSISATTSYSAFNVAQGLGGGGGGDGLGFAGGALRGLGFQFTVVLVNGRRIAHHPLAPRGEDLNSIPLAAVDRVEVLKDGASAIYGSDAIGGVINFILRKDYRGFDVSAQYASPEHVGGYEKRITASGGFGDLASQKFNVQATVDYEKSGGIEARDRPFAARSYIPDYDIDRTSLESSPANVGTPLGQRNPSGDPGNGYRNPSCAPPQSSFTASNPYECRWFGDGSVALVPPTERLHVVASLAWQLDPQHQLFVDATWARNRFTYTPGPTAVSNLTTSPGSDGFLLPPASPFYPHAFARTFGVDGTPLALYWRAVELGQRTIEPTAEQWSAVAGMQGLAMGWRYDAAFNYSRAQIETRYANGFVRESVLLPILNSGVVNPFGANTEDVVNAMSVAKIDGVLSSGRSSIAVLDFHASKDVLALPAGPMALAAGIQVLREKLEQTAEPVLASGDVLNTNSAASLSGSQNVEAAFAEVAVPLLESLDANVAVRYDHYDDFGSTTNPKISVRWQPVSRLLLRASAGTGFLAPSIQGLFRGSALLLTPEAHDDPARCPHTGSVQDCDRRFPALFGGNPALQPVVSRQWSAGAVLAPTRTLSLGIDYVSILLDDRINFISSVQVFDQCPDGITGRTCQLIHRGSIDPANPALPGPITQVDQFLTNLGKAKVSAIDVNAQYIAPTQRFGRFAVALDGTYNVQHLEQQADGSYVDLVGKYSTSGGNPGVVPRWRHYLTLTWAYGSWTATLSESYQTGTYDQAPPAGSGGTSRRIAAYDVWNLSAIYAGFARWTLSAGIRNLLDRDPPFSVQDQSLQVGYDPSYADPHGRLYWAGARYSFR